MEPTSTEQAAETAKKLVQDTAIAADERTSTIVRESINDFFNKGLEEKRFLDVARIPFICDDIKSIKNDMKILTKMIYIGLGVLAVAAMVIPILITFSLKFVK